MKGLVLKDFYVLKQSLRVYLAMIVIYAVMVFAGMFDSSMVCGIMGIMVTMLPISGFSYDDLARWDKYAASLPVGRKGIVMSKYIFTLCMVAATFVACTIINFIMVYFHVGTMGMAGLMMSTVYCLLIGLLINAVLTPLIFKFGSEKSRIMMITVFAVVFGGVYALSNLVPGGLDSLTPFMEGQLFMPIAVAAAAAVLLISYLVSCSIYSRKEL